MQARADKNPLINQIKFIFYNDLTNLAWDESDITLENIAIKIKSQIGMTILQILDLVNPDKKIVCLPNSQIITYRG